MVYSSTVQRLIKCAGYRTSAACLAAQNFTMPAMSPTMTEGNISSWKIKEGDSFAAGDVILEIETDKAQMDVEAQDDGILFKIMEKDGSKAVKVGTRIGVLAGPDDDLSSLEIPKDEADASTPKKKAAKPEPTKRSSSASEAPPATETASSPDSSAKPAKNTGKAKKQTYPLLPSVQYLVHEKGLSEADIEKMTPSGPNNRLLKGDVLAYLGTIGTEYPTELSTKINKLTHLDLSNIKMAPRKEAPKAAKKEAATVEETIQDVEVAVPISMSAVTEVQERIEASLGVFMPLSTFIARAADYANEDLPRSKSYTPTSDELFDAVLGLDKVSSRGARGTFLPQITALPATAIATMPRAKASAPKSDIIDILTGKKPLPTKRTQSPILPGVAATTNIFSVNVPKGDEKRAQIFLERVKSVLEAEPGSLVL